MTPSDHAADRSGLQARLLDAMLRPPPVFDAEDLFNLERFALASGIRPEGVGGVGFDLTTRPYLTPLYHERRDTPYPRLVVMKAAQMGLTVRLLYRAAWFTADARRRVNTALMFPTKDDVQDLHASRYRPMMQSSAKMMQLITDLDRVGLVRVGASTMRFRGMRSGIGVDSFPADVMLFDEVRLMATATIERALVRVSDSLLQDAQGRRGVIELNSTAGFPNQDIDRWFQRSTMNYWRTPCPNSACRHHSEGIVMPLHWPDIVSQRDGDLHYQCPHCSSPIPDDVLMKRGWYAPENPGAEWEGYQFSQVLKGNRFLPEIWGAFSRGDNMAEFYNSRLGVPWTDPQAVPATQERVEACIDGTNTYHWPDPATLQGEWVSIGIDQRAPEKHVVIVKPGPGGLYDLAHLEVVELSGMEAVSALAALCRRWYAKIVVIDGEPSYDLAVALARRLGHKVVWLADYVDRPNAIEFSDERDKATTSKASGEVKYEFRALMDRYKALDWALTRFMLKRIRLPADFKRLQQTRTIGGVPQPMSLADEFMTHLSNIARATVPLYTRLPTGEQAYMGESRRVYRHLAVDPHFAHAWLNALAGLEYMRGQTDMHLWGSSDPTRLPETAKTQLNDLLPVGVRPIDAERVSVVAAERTCGNCKFYRPQEGDKGLCGHPSAANWRLWVTTASPHCPHYRRGGNA